METKYLYRICGIRTTVTVKESWSQGTLKFLGAENYVLGTKKVEFQLLSNKKGVALTFKSLPKLPAEKMMGASVPTVTIVDCRICLEGVFDLSLASLSPGLYPQVLRKGDTVRII